MSALSIHELAVSRTARYAVLGTPAPTVRHVWFVLHGYGQLAADFLRTFETLSSVDRWFVAPEGLSRFYLDSRSERVGASWMTREDRQNEIGDYVNYLELAAERVSSDLSSSHPALHVLGFSQGTSTACRWVSAGQRRFRSLILWAGDIPPEIDLSAIDSPFRHTELCLVAGTRDTWATPERVTADRLRLEAAEIPHAHLSFDGGHRIDVPLLRHVVARMEQERATNE